MPRDVSTRWNSTYDMIVFALEYCKAIAAMTADADNNLILIKVKPGKPFVYYIGSGWDRGLDFKSADEWEAYVIGQALGFQPIVAKGKK